MKNSLIRIITFMLIICMVLTCAACGGDSTKTTNSDKGLPNKPTSSTPSDTSSDISQDDTSNTSSDTPISKPTIDPETAKYYNPTSLTMNFYDTSALSYGFTWNTEFIPIEPVIQICEGKSFNQAKCTEISATVKNEAVLMPGTTYIYVCKAVVPLKQNTTYTYRAFDKGAGVGSETSTFKTANFKANSFKFVHVSDSQVADTANDHSAIGTGKYFTDTLKGIFKSKPDFMIHTGDIVEYSQYETYWKDMLNTNKKYLMQMPVMAISGNHETTYRAGSNEIFKHFNNKIPAQASTNRGYYYSFEYGNTRFIMLNTNNTDSGGLEREQYNWLVNELKNNKKKWTIVSMHNPMYSVGKYGADPGKNSISIALRSQLTSLFAEYKVDLVLQGHDHAYSKTYPIGMDGGADVSPTYKIENGVEYTVNPNGTIYSMHGPAGNQSRSPYEVKKNIFEIGMASKTNSWAEITVENNRLTVKVMYAEDGENKLAFSYGIIKE